MVVTSQSKVVIKHRCPTVPRAESQFRQSAQFCKLYVVNFYPHSSTFTMNHDITTLKFPSDNPIGLIIRNGEYRTTAQMSESDLSQYLTYLMRTADKPFNFTLRASSSQMVSSMRIASRLMPPTQPERTQVLTALDFLLTFIQAIFMRIQHQHLSHTHLHSLQIHYHYHLHTYVCKVYLL
jgi:hypothetical protein